MSRAHIDTLASQRGPLVRTFLPSLALGLALCMGAVHASASGLAISGTPAGSVPVGGTYDFTPIVTDSRTGRTLKFTISNKPYWIWLNTKTGHILGWPTSAYAGTYSNIRISVSDGISSATLPAFTVTVGSGSSGQDVVKISGTPPSSVTAGSPYSFKPTASSSAGRTLAFSVQNKPAWASFSIASGLLSGTPAGTQAGIYGGIVISASDGKASSALGPFSVSVSGAASNGQATLDWSNPTQNTNGTPLTNLAGVRIYYGPSSSSMTQLAQVTGPSVTSYTANNLSAGTWYFGAVAYTTSGAQSSMSGVVSKTVQ